MGYFYDATYIFVIIGAVISIIASINVKSTYSKYSKVTSRTGLTADRVAEMILRGAGIYDVRIERIGGKLTDHYSPKEKVLRLSDSVYGSTSVAAIGVAAHECGHAIQHAEGYSPLKFRSAIVPVVNIGSKLSWPVILIGLLLDKTDLMNLGIILFSFIVIFQVITLPVEFNASKRAITILNNGALLYPDEIAYADSVLTAAALTYVAAMVTSVLQLLRLITIFGRRN
ncbi:MAG: zinc metallopeptidase [Coprococcus sp.]